MKNNCTFYILRSAVLCQLLLLPVLSSAENSATSSAPANSGTGQSTYHGSVNLGLGSVSMDENENHKYGEYSGIEGDDNHLILNFDFEWQDQSAYMEVEGKDMGIDSRRSVVETGQYGNFSLKFKHQQIPHLESTNAATPFNGVGSDRLSLPAGFTRANSTANMTNLDANLKNITVRTDRTEDHITYTNYLGTSKNLKMVLDFRSETKDGIQSLGGTIGEHPGFVDAVIMPVPVNYKTKEIGAKLSFNRNRTTFELGYFLSKFTNENDSVTWDIPFSAELPPPIATPYPATARTSLPVDNEYHKINFNIVSKLSQTLVLSAVIEAGIMKQDEEFLPYSIDGSLVSTPLPRDSAEAEVYTRLLNLNITGRPNAKLNWRGKIRHYETDNKTPVDQFQRVTLDTATQSGADGEKDNPNHAYDYEQDELSIDGTYRFGRALSVSAGYEIEKMKRSHREVDETEDKTARVKIKSRLTSNMKGTIHYSQSKREGDDYDSNQAFFDAYTQNYLNIVIGANIFPFWNHPNMRKFDVADRDMDILGLQLDYAANLNTNIGIFYSERNEDYAKDLLGMNYSDNSSYGLDVDYTPNDTVSVYFNYTHETFDAKQSGHSFTFMPVPPPPGPPAPVPGVVASQAADPTRAWDAVHEDEIDTYEIGGHFKVWEEKLTLKASYMYSEADNDIAFTHGGSTDAFADPATDISGDKSKRQNVRLAGEYHKTENMGIELGMVYEKLDYFDWQKAGIEAGGTAIADVLPLNGEVPDNEVYFIYTTVNYKW